MKLEECTEVEFIIPKWLVILCLCVLAVCSLVLIIYSFFERENIHELIFCGTLLLVLFFGLVFTLYKMDCKKKEYAIELKRLDILEKHLEEMAKK